MNGTDALIALARAFEDAGLPYIEEWCGTHETLDLLAEAKSEAAFAWEDE
jgi:hypothetical protein